MEALRIRVIVENEATGQTTEEEAWVLGRNGSTFLERGEQLLQQAIITSLAPENYDHVVVSEGR